MKYPFELGAGCPDDYVREQYTLAVGDLYDALEVVDDLQRALSAVLDDRANPLKVSCRLRLEYLLERAIATLDKNKFGVPHEP